MEENFGFFTIGLLIGGFLSGFGIWGMTNTNWHTETVERGLAMYCPDDGQWAWKGECGNDH